MSLKQKLEELSKMNYSAHYETTGDMCEGSSSAKTEEHIVFYELLKFWHLYLVGKFNAGVFLSVTTNNMITFMQLCQCVNIVLFQVRF
jgi:hypothetical protein